MNRHRRQFLHLAAGAVAWPLASRAAMAQAYPSQPLRWVIGFPPGGPTDILVRIMGEWLQTRLGQPVVVENKPGAASNIATETVINAAPDGYTIGSRHLRQRDQRHAVANLPFDLTLEQLVPVAGMSQGPSVLVVHPSIRRRASPSSSPTPRPIRASSISRSPGVGSTGHLAGELFKAMAGVDIVHVPYRGAAPAMTDLIGGQIQVIFDSTW